MLTRCKSLFAYSRKPASLFQSPLRGKSLLRCCGDWREPRGDFSRFGSR